MLHISKIIWVFTALMASSIHVHSTVVDMGTCGCVCGESNTDNEAVITRGGVKSNFYNRIRGPKGDSGNPGKRGPTGPRGGLGIKGMKGDEGPHYTPSRSCHHLRQSGETSSGIYSIKPSPMSSMIEVFCDMTSAGGGWTLVASVHEDDIKGKCTMGDKWSSERGQMGDNYHGSMNWENYNTFGTAEGATSNDYKSPAYFDVPASDVMIWHVPNDVRINQASSRATLKYYTDNEFLRQYGGTLQSLFSEYYPMKNSYSNSVTDDDMINLASQFNSTAYAIRSLVSQFYSYTYDFSGTRQNYIGDGGNDMFDTGNKIFYQIGAEPETHITYNLLYSNDTEESNVKVLASTSHPFNMIMWIGNALRQVPSFGIKVNTGTGADGSGSTVQYTGNIRIGTFQLHYHSYNVYAANDPSITEVFYYISNEKWLSVPPTSFIRTPWTSGDDNLQHGVKLTGRPRFVMVGYMLLSKTGGTLVSDTEVKSVLRKTIDVMSTFRTVADCNRGNDSLVQPIYYIQGDNETVMSGIPPRSRAQSTPGFIQFRAYSQLGTPHSICPGVKTISCRPQSVCIGGVNAANTDVSACGDFAGWDGSPEDSPTAEHPNGYAKSLQDQQSSILIFTREKH